MEVKIGCSQGSSCMKEFVIKTQLSVKYAQHSTGRVYSANAMPGASLTHGERARRGSEA